MMKFKIGDKVKYNGSNEMLKEWCSSMEVLEVVPSGCPIGNGETNISVEDIYRTQNKNTKMLFRESELAAI